MSLLGHVSKMVSILLSKLSDCPNTDTSLCYCNNPFITVWYWAKCFLYYSTVRIRLVQWYPTAIWPCIGSTGVCYCTINVKQIGQSLHVPFPFSFCSQDAIASGIFAVLYLSAAIGAAVIASLWDEWVDYGEDNLSESYRDEFNLDFTGIRDSYAVCSVR